jgi:dihydropyrimidine dehydrogenase (NAD+) subunit PreA
MTLQIEFLGMKLKTPFLVGSGPWLSQGSEVKNIVTGLAPYWGGIVTKSYIHPSGRHPYLRPNLWTTNEFRGVAMQNCGPPCTRLTEKELIGLKESCKAAHDEGLVVIGSIMGKSDNDWREMPRQMEEANVDAIELNLSCPADIDSHRGKGRHIGQVPEQAARIMKLVKESTSLPVLAKLNAIVSDIAEIASACEGAGADGISAINTIPGIIGIDVETGIPYSSDHEDRAYASGVSGSIIRPVGLRCVSDIYKKVDIPIFGIGGIDGWKSAVEYMMVGAPAVQVCTAFMLKGFKLGKRMCKGLSEFMERKGYSSVNDFCGISHKYITTEYQEISVRAVVDEEKCNLCGQCIPACCETQHIALSLEDKKKVIVDEERCQGCGLCAVVCKQQAISFASK